MVHGGQFFSDASPIWSLNPDDVYVSKNSNSDIARLILKSTAFVSVIINNETNVFCAYTPTGAGYQQLSDQR